MTASKKLTGAAAKSQRQTRLTVVRTDEQQPQEQPVNIQPATTDTQPTVEQLSLADLRAQQRALKERIKEAKASEPKPEKQPKPAKTLDAVVARQSETVGIGHVIYIAQRAMARVKLGQDVDGAVNEVARREGQAAKGALDLFNTGDYPTLRDALMAWCSENAPATAVKQHTQITEGDHESSDEQ
jgi:hypothetical protein